MRISTRLKIAALVPVLMALVSGTGLLASRRSFERHDQSQTAALQIRDKMGNLNDLVVAYVAHHEQGPRQQFLDQHAQTARLIRATSFDAPLPRQLLEDIARGNDVLKSLFLKLVSNHEQQGPAVDGALLAEAEDRLVGQIQIRSRDARDDASQLVAVMDREMAAGERRWTSLTLAFVGAAAACLTVFLLALTRRIAAPIARLQRGAETIGGGDLTHRIGLSSPDEIGRLAQAFDRMTGKLQATTVWRDELVVEVEQRKRAQDELRRQQEWLRVTLTSIGDAVIATDADGLITFLNPVAAALTGWTQDQAIGRPVAEVFRVVDEQTRESAGDFVAQVLRENRVITLANHTALVRRDGSEAPIEDSAAPIRDAQGHVVGAVLVFHDVTAKRRDQEALHASEERYRSLFNNMTEGFALHEIITDPRGRPCDYRFLDLNPAFERLTGLKRADVIGRTVKQVLPDTESYWIDTFGQVALTGQSAHFESYSTALGKHCEVLAYQPAPRQFAVIFMDVTQRKRLEEQTAWLASFPKLNPQPVVEVGADGQVHYANPAAQALFPDLQRRGVDHPWLSEASACALDAGPGVHLREVEVDGRCYEQAVHSVRDSQRVRIYARDITNRKRAEQALRASEERYRHLVTASPDAILVHRDGRALYANPAALKLYGADSIEQLAAHDIIRELVPPAERDIAVQRTEAVMAGQGQPLRQGHIIRLDGQLVPMEVIATFVDYQGGRAVQAIYRDVTERKQAEEDLRQAKEELEHRVAERTADLAKLIETLEQEARERVAAEAAAKTERQRLYDVMETLPVYVVLLTGDYHVPFANRFFRERFGESNGRRCYEYLFGRTEPCDVCDTYEVLKTLCPHQWEWTGPDGRTYDIHDFPFTDTDGSRLIMEVGIDITDRKRAEQALLQRSEQLRALASELTLTEQRERQRLAYVLHDGLQQLLVGAKFRLALLDRLGDGNLQRIVRQVDELISDSIETSRSLTAELSPLILKQGGLVAALEWLARWMQDKHALTVNLQARADIPPISEDLTILLFQATRELLFNVVKHAGVKIASVNVSSQDGHIRIAVADEGAGFDPVQLRAEGGQAGGFGLFGIRERLELLGGRLEIDAAPGRGSRFELIAPLPDQPARDPASTGGAPARVSVGMLTPSLADDAGKIRIVLVDDHPVLRQGLAALLREEPDMQVVGEASDGLSAVDLVRQVRPDVVLMDISMPGMDGVEAAAIIHAQMPGVRIIGLSMFREADRSDAMLQAGATTYIAKTDPSDTLTAAIRSCARPTRA